MTEKQKLIGEIATSIREAEALHSVAKTAMKMLDFKLKCLHDCLEKGLEVLGETVPEGPTVYGGVDKDKPGKP